MLVLNIIWKICTTILTMQSTFISSTIVRNKNATNLQDVLVAEHEDHVHRAMVLLKVVGFAQVSLSTNATAKKQLWSFKRELKTTIFTSLRSLTFCLVSI